jgi:hypothetical protein
MINPKYYTKEFQSFAMAWWKSLSINEQKAFEKKHGTIYGSAIPSEIAEIFDKETEVVTSNRTFS